MASRRDRQGKRPVRPTADERGRYVLQPEWVRAETLINVGLIVLGVYIVQAFISSNVTDVAGRVSIVAWAIAIPLLAFFALLTQLRESFRYVSNPLYLRLASVVAQGAAVIGFGAAVWRLWMPAGLVLLASGLAGFIILRMHYRRLVRDNTEDGGAG